MTARKDALFEGYRVWMLVKVITMSSCAIGVVLCGDWDANAAGSISVEVFGVF